MAANLLRTRELPATPTQPPIAADTQPATVTIIAPAKTPTADPLEWLNDNLSAWTTRVHSRYRAQTAKAKLSRLRTFIEWAVGIEHTSLSNWRDVTPTLVDRFIEYRRSAPAAYTWNRAAGDDREPSPVSAGTIDRNLQAVRLWLLWNEETEMTGPIRSQYLRGRVADERDPDRFTLTPSQQVWLLERAKLAERGQRVLRFIEPGSGKNKSAWCAHWPAGAFYVFCRLGLLLGLRPRELFWLAWDDITELGDGGGLLRVQSHEVQVNGRRVVANQVKTSQSRRKLLVPADLLSEILELRQSLHQAGDVRPFLFAVRDERAACGWVKPEIQFIFKALKRELGDERLRCNTMRKTAGWNLRRKGLDYFAVAQFLGHSPQTCMQHYVQDCRDEEAFDPVSCKPVKLAACRHDSGPLALCEDE